MICGVTGSSFSSVTSWEVLHKKKKFKTLSKLYAKKLNNTHLSRWSNTSVMSWNKYFEFILLDAKLKRFLHARQ